MTTDLQEITHLIQKAGVLCGSEYKLAKSMGIPQAMLTDWKAGRRTCTPEDQARLAGFAQEDAVQALVRGVLRKNEGTLKGEQLRAVLGKWLHQTGGATGSALAVLASLTFGLLNTDVLRCILC